MTQLSVKDANGTTQSIEAPLAPGRTAATGSRPVALSNEDSASLGALTETAPTTDTASSGINGRLQRISQRLTALIALLPTALGTGGGLKVDGSGTALPVSAASLPLPTGAATSANQSADQVLVGPVTEAVPASDTASSGLNGRLQRIAQRLTSLIALLPAALGAGGGLKVDGSGTALPISAAALPLPTGAATAAKQPALGTAGASSIDVVSVQGVAGGTPLPVTLSGANTNGQATSANSAPVVIASDQSNLPISAKPTATVNGTTSSRINAAASTNATSLKASAGQVYSIDVFNVAAYDVFLKFYNKASAPTVGTDTPVWTIPIKAGAGYSNVFPLGKAFSTGIAYAITKLQADSDTTAVAALDVTGTMDWI
jgi:hypothetical protein